MRYLKNFNNNAALVEDDSGKEYVIIGNGIGFGKHPGDLVDEGKIERRFVPSDSNTPEIEEFKNIRPQAIEVTSKVTAMLAQKGNLNFSDYQYFVLVDHIDFALKRSLDGIEIPDGTVRWNVKHLFPNEYKLACEAIQLIESEFSVKLPVSEQIFMTYHLLDAESDGTKLQDTVKITQLIAGIVSIVQYDYHIELDHDSFNYNRFVNHLRSLMIQHLSGKWHQGQELDPAVLEIMRQRYPQAAETVERINTFLTIKNGWQLNPDDKVYLILHVWRVTHRQTDD